MRAVVRAMPLLLAGLMLGCSGAGRTVFRRDQRLQKKLPSRLRWLGLRIIQTRFAWPPTPTSCA